MRNHRISKACLLFVVMLIAGACGSRRPRPSPPAAPAKGTGRVLLKANVYAIQENNEGELCATVAVYNDSDFPVMLRIPDGGVRYDVTKEDGSYDDVLAGKGHYETRTIGFGGSDMNLATEYFLLAARVREGAYPVDGVYGMDLVLLTAAEYRKQKAVYDKQSLFQKLRKPLKAQLSLRLDYLQTCDGVVEGNATSISFGAYEYVELKKELAIVPAGRAAKKP